MVTEKPRALSSLPKDAAVIPFPKPETTPPVTNTYLTATQVMEILGVSRATAYKTIHELNEELQQNGYRIIAGKVSAKYFEEKYYGLQVMQ